MEKMILYKILHFKGHWLALLALVLAVTDYVAQHLLEAQLTQSAWDFVVRIEMQMAHAVCIGIWIAAALAIISKTYYSDKTGGRNLWLDMRDYHRTIFELIRVFSSADPYRMDKDELSVQSWKTAVGIILGHKGPRLIYRPTWAYEGDGANFALFALPGAGKTTCQIIPSALCFGGSVLAIDIKGDILNATRQERRIKIFAPDDPDYSEHFNPLKGIANMRPSERKTFIEQIAMTLIPEEHGQDSKYFIDGARDLFTAISIYLISSNASITLPEIARNILTGNAIDWIEKIRDSDCIDAREYSDSYYGTNETNVSGCYNEAVKRIRPFASGELAEILSDNGRCISTKTLDDGYDIYIEIPQHKIQVLAPVTTLIVQKFMTEFEKRKDRSSGTTNQPVLFLLDEVAQLNLDGDTLSAALSTLRSKSVSIFLAMQSIGQLRKKYGEDCAREIIDTCAYISVMSAQDPESRAFFEKIFGTKRVLKTTSNEGYGGSSWWSGNIQSGSSSRGAQEEREPVIRAEDFGNLNDKVAILANGKHILADKCKWYE